MYEEIETIREHLDSIERESKVQDAELYKAKREANRYKTILLEFLKSKIGQKIYWAHKDWEKYEAHTITDIRVEIRDSDFFGKEYVGKECIHIYVKGGGCFIADNIGKTLFFDKDEAELHTYKDNPKDVTQSVELFGVYELGI